jgi:hypothetical protein
MLEISLDSRAHNVEGTIPEIVLVDFPRVVGCTYQQRTIGAEAETGNKGAGRAIQGFVIGVPSDMVGAVTVTSYKNTVKSILGVRRVQACPDRDQGGTFLSGDRADGGSGVGVFDCWQRTPGKVTNFTGLGDLATAATVRERSVRQTSQTVEQRKTFRRFHKIHNYFNTATSPIRMRRDDRSVEGVAKGGAFGLGAMACAVDLDWRVQGGSTDP